MVIVFLYEGGYSRFGIFCYIDNVKVDIVYYSHERIAPLKTIDGIRMYDCADISAMKIQAILGLGKKKDFFDIAELLQHFSVNDIVENHRKKYPDQMLLISIPQAMTYFTDADQSEEAVSLKKQTNRLRAENGNIICIRFLTKNMKIRKAISMR